MKSTGIIRDIDSVGRIVLPIEIRRTLNLEPKDPVEIYTEDDMIILKKYQRSCHFCGSEGELSEYKGKLICKGCLDGLCSIRNVE